MHMHSGLHQKLHMALSPPHVGGKPVPHDHPTAIQHRETQMEAHHIKRDMHMLEGRLQGLNHEKAMLDEHAHVERIHRLETLPHTTGMHPHIAGSHAHALYAGGVNALPPRSWLDSAPQTRELLTTQVPPVTLAPPQHRSLVQELSVLKKLNPAETIATLQRLNITATEKLALFRDLDLESIAGAHSQGMLAHAKAGLPVHRQEAEANMVEHIRASVAHDVDKVHMIRDMPLSPSKKIELLRELEVQYA